MAFRSLNSTTIRDRFPIPTMDKLIDELNDTSIFSKLDLMASSHQICVREEDVEKIAFQTHHGHYKFTVMPFGLTNAPLTCQATMNHLFRDILQKYVIIFFMMFSFTTHPGSNTGNTWNRC